MFARKHFLSEQTLEMLVDMRWQFACMLADSKLVEGSSRGSRGHDWMDDPKQPFNAHAAKPAVVSHQLQIVLLNDYNDHALVIHRLQIVLLHSFKACAAKLRVVRHRLQIGCCMIAMPTLLSQLR